MTYPFYLMILILILFGGSRPDNRPAFLGREKVRLFLIVIMLIPFTNVIQYRLETRMLNFQTAIDYNWHELQLWVKDHTPKHSVFLVPPYVNGFRAFSKRSTIIERLDGTASHWRKGFEKIWTERLQDLGYEGTFPRIGFDGMREDDPSTVRARSIYASINDEKIRHLQKKYTIDFVVVEDYHHLPFPVVFQNDDFKIYQVTDS